MGLRGQGTEPGGLSRLGPTGPQEVALGCAGVWPKPHIFLDTLPLCPRMRLILAPSVTQRGSSVSHVLYAQCEVGTRTAPDS